MMAMNRAQAMWERRTAGAISVAGGRIAGFRSMLGRCVLAAGLACCARPAAADEFGLGEADTGADDLLAPARRSLAEFEKKKAAEAAARKAAAAAEAAAAQQAESASLPVAELRKVAHPRLLVTPERLAVIRAQIKVPGSHFQLAYAGMLRRAEQDPIAVWGGNARKGYWPVYASREYAFLSLVEEDPARKRQYAEMAAKVLPDLHYVQWFGFKSRSLGHAMATFGTALTYDWAYNEWTEAERRKCELLLAYFRKHWETYHRVKEELDQVSAYNFYGVLFGAQIMMHLAMGGEKTEARFPLCVDILAKHLSEVGGELGAHNEGIGYTEYPMGFALPAALALAQHGEARPLAAAKTHAFWTLNMFVQTFMTSFERKIVQYGVSHQSNSNEGFASLVLGLCPADVLPYYLWFYDRNMGRLSKAEADRRFDYGRGNTPFSLMLYPVGIEARDPTGVWPKAVADGDGYIFFRNRWRDENDVQVGLLNPVRRSGGWSQSEYLNLRLMAYDTRFFGGPGKERGVENYTTLLVDGLHEPKTKAPGGFVPGRIESFEATSDGGYAVVDASAFYQGLGVSNVQRHLRVAFGDAKEGTAVLSTLDDIRSAREHRYTWQANLGPEGVIAPVEEAEEEESAAGKKPAGGSGKPASPDVPSLDDVRIGLALPATAPKMSDTAKPAKAPASEPAAPKPCDDGIRSESGMEGGRAFFLLSGRQGYIKGWVLEPADATIAVGDPLRIDTRGTDRKIWVVMHAGMGAPAAAEISGRGMDSVLKVGGRTVKWDAAAGRIVTDL